MYINNNLTTVFAMSVPVGYIIAAVFLILAIVLFVISVFMKDTDEYYNEAEFERQRARGRRESEDVLKKETVELKNLVAGVTGELELTRAFDVNETRVFREENVDDNNELEEEEDFNLENIDSDYVEDDFNDIEIKDTESDVLQPQNKGLSFADEVKRLIEEEERRNKK